MRGRTSPNGICAPSSRGRTTPRVSRRWRSTFLLPQTAHVEPRQRERQDQGQGRGRRPVAELEDLEGLDVGVHGQGRRRIHGPALGHRVDQVEDLVGVDDPEQEDRNDHRPHERGGDREELPPPSGPVDLRRLVEALVDRMQAREQQEHVEGDSDPQIRDDDGDHRGRRAREPGDRMLDEAEEREEVVEHSVVGVEDPLEDRPGDDGRKDPADEEERSDHPVPREGLTEEEREGVADDELEDEARRGEDRREHHSVPEAGVGDDRPIVLEAAGGEIPRDEIRPVRVAHRDPHVVDERREQEDRDVDEGGRGQGEAQAADALSAVRGPGSLVRDPHFRVSRRGVISAAALFAASAGLAAPVRAS